LIVEVTIHAIDGNEVINIIIGRSFPSSA